MINTINFFLKKGKSVLWIADFIHEMPISCSRLAETSIDIEI